VRRGRPDGLALPPVAASDAPPAAEPSSVPFFIRRLDDTALFEAARGITGGGHQVSLNCTYHSGILS